MSGGDVIGLRVQEDEKYVGRRELAVLLGLSIPTIDRWVKEGMPSETWGLRRRMFLPSRARAWAREREARRAAA